MKYRRAMRARLYQKTSRQCWPLGDGAFSVVGESPEVFAGAPYPTQGVGVRGSTPLCVGINLSPAKSQRGA